MTNKKNLIAGNGAGCQECSKIISGEALRCTECDKVMHLTCSRLPDYSLAMYIITRNQYLCAACVEKRGDKDSIFADTMAKIASLKKAESDASPPALDDTNSTITESLEGFDNGQAVHSAAGGTQSDPPSQVDSSQEHDTEDRVQSTSQVHDNNMSRSTPGGNKTRICRYFVRKTCKHGVKGEGCAFKHPKKCDRFMNHGDKNSKGCKKGNSCAYFHPPLCWESLRERVCRRENCRYHHLRRTKKWEPPVFERRPSAQAKPEQANTQTTRRTYARVVHPGTANEQHKGTRDEPSQDFLELKEQVQQQMNIIKQMQMQMQGQLWDPRLMAYPPGDYRRHNASHY